MRLKMKEKKEKNQKLEEKVNKLVEKLEEKIEEIKSEKSPVKRLRYMIKCKMLVNKIQRQKDLLKARKKFESEKEENNFTAKELKTATRGKIIKINEEIKALQRRLNANSEYDFDSSDFIFSEEDVRSAGGVSQYADELEESQELEQIETAEKIRETMADRKKLADLRADLEEQKEFLEDIDYELKSANSTWDRGMMMVTAKSKFNIFARIRNLASSVVYGVKEFREELRQNRSVDEIKAGKFEQLQASYEMKKEEIRKEYEKKMEDLEKAYLEVDEEKTDEWAKIKETKKESIRKGQSAKFQEQLQNMAKPVQEEPTLPSEEDIIKQTEEYEKNYDKEQNNDKQQNAQEDKKQDEEVYKPDAVITPNDGEIEI